MKFPNKYLRNLKPYRLASHKIWSVSPENRNTVLKLDWNESTIPPSPLVKERISSLINEPTFFNLYPTTNNESLLNALSEYVGLPKENIQYFAGSDALHEYICKVFISVGDPVLILGPSYDNFRLTCQANGADVYFSNYNDVFCFDKSRFEEDIYKIEPAVVYICNPNNPTGNLLPIEYIEYLLTEYPDTLFLIDEAYYEFSGLTAKEFVRLYDNILISRTMSKAFGLANFRVGYLISSKDNIQFVNKIRNPKNLSTFAQEAALAALSDLDYMWSYVSEVHKGMDYFYQQTLKYKDYFTVYKSHGNFMLVQFISHDLKMSMMAYLAKDNIFVRDTTQSSLVMNCIRITIGTVPQMQRVLNSVNSFFDNGKNRSI